MLKELDTNELVSFMDIDLVVNRDKKRWIKFVHFSRDLNKQIKQYHDSEIRKFWSNYQEEKIEPILPWIDVIALDASRQAILEDKDRSHTRCFRNLKLNKKILQIDDFSIFDELDKDFPNFSEVTNYYRGALALNQSRNIKNYQAPKPVLLLGNPGIGKTHYAKKIAQIMGASYKFLDSNSVSSGSVLTGCNASWRGADAGFIFKTLASSQTVSPIILLDEIDKMTNREHSPFSALHQILETENSKNLYDEFLDLEFDASNIIYILTANDITSVAKSLLSRMNVFTIKNPSADSMKNIVQTIYSKILDGSSLFANALDSIEVDKLLLMTPREVTQVISQNIFNQSSDAIKSKSSDNNLFINLNKLSSTSKFGF
jgi:ATP-dependent Lon protease